MWKIENISKFSFHILTIKLKPQLSWFGANQHSLNCMIFFTLSVVILVINAIVTAIFIILISIIIIVIIICLLSFFLAIMTQVLNLWKILFTDIFADTDIFLSKASLFRYFLNGSLSRDFFCKVWFNQKDWKIFSILF